MKRRMLAVVGVLAAAVPASAQYRIIDLGTLGGGHEPCHRHQRGWPDRRMGVHGRWLGARLRMAGWRVPFTPSALLSILPASSPLTVPVRCDHRCP